MCFQHTSKLSSLCQRKTKQEEDVPKTIYLVPELCNLTGLTDQMKADFKVMKDVAQFTRVTPNQRQEVSSFYFSWLFDAYLNPDFACNKILKFSTFKMLSGFWEIFSV